MFPKTITLSFDEALNTFDAIAGVIYENKAKHSDEDPDAWLCCFTLADCWLVDAIPMRNIEGGDFEPFEGYRVGVPVHTDSFGEAIGYYG